MRSPWGERSDGVEELNRELPAVNHILRYSTPDHRLIAASNLGQHRPAYATCPNSRRLADDWAP
jgi:hypothetical protein